MGTRGFEVGAVPTLLRLLLENLLGAVLSLIPAEWRRWWESEASDAVLSGTIEAVLGSYFFLSFFIHSMNSELRGLSIDTVTQLGMAHGDTGVAAMGPIILIGLLFKPTALITLIVGFEGYIRAANALITQDVAPSLFFWIPAKAWKVVRKAPRLFKKAPQPAPTRIWR